MVMGLTKTNRIEPSLATLGSGHNGATHLLPPSTVTLSPRRPRLLLIGPYFRPKHYGGAVQVYHQLLMRSRKLDSVLVSQRLGTEPAEMERFDRDCPREYGYGIVRVGRFDLVFRPNAKLMERVLDAGRFFLTTRAEWRRIVREVQPDVIVCGATLAAGWLMDHTPESIPFVNYLHGEELSSAGASRFVRPYLFRRQLHAIRKADLNISVSRYTARTAAALARIKSERFELLPNFVDISRFSPPKDREKVRTELGWHNHRIILTLARLTPRKGIDQAIRALAKLRNQGKLSPTWLHVIGGQGEQEDELRNLAKKLNVAEYTRFEGFVDDEHLPDYYGAADLFLQPNRDLSGETEGFGVVFLESNACGTPVIGGISGGTADAIRDGVTGYRVDSEDLSAIGRAVLELTQNDDLRRRMGSAGVEVVRRDHRIEVAVSRFEDLICQVCSVSC